MTLPSIEQGEKARREWLVGDAWWRHKSGWDQIAVHLIDWQQTLIQCHKYMQAIKEKQRDRLAAALKNVYNKQWEIKQYNKKIEALVAKAEELKAGVVVRLEEAELALKRGQTAVTVAEWEAMQKKVRDRYKRRGIRRKVKKSVKLRQKGMEGKLP